MIIHTVFSYLPLYFMLQLAAAAPGLFMPLFMLLLKMILLKLLVIIVVLISKTPYAGEPPPDHPW